jgi:hypothetical protein
MKKQLNHDGQANGGSSKQVPKELQDHHNQLRNEVKHAADKLSKATEHSLIKGWLTAEQAKSFGDQAKAAFATLEGNLKAVEDANAK